MAVERHLPRPPIKEALIDIQVAFPEKVTVEALNSNFRKFADQYPKHEILQRGEFGFHNKAGEPTTVTVGHTLAGYRFSSEDGCRVVQFRLDGFTFSRLEPYSTWEEMKQEAASMWKVYVDAVSPNTITRVGTRYINVLKLPVNEELHDYLTEPPRIPTGLNQELNSFLTRVDINDPKTKARGFLTQALESVHSDHVPIVLDIDVFVAKQFDPGEEEFWSCLDKLREFKNKVFFESITEKAVECFL